MSGREGLQVIESHLKMSLLDNNFNPLQKSWIVLFSIIIIHNLVPIVGRFISSYLTTYFLLLIVLMVLHYFIHYRMNWWSSIFISLIIIKCINASNMIAHGGSMVNTVYGAFLSFCPVLIGLRLSYLPPRQVKTFFKVAAFAIIITSITTIRGLTTYPGAARILATFEDSQNPLLTQYEWLNIGGFAFTYTLLTIYPIIIGYVRQTYDKLWLKVILTGLFATFFFSAEYMTALTGFILISSLWFIPKNYSYKKLFMKLGIVLLFFVASKGLLANILYDAAALNNSIILQERMLYMADGLAGVENTSDVGSREDVLRLSLEGFMSSPITGNWYKGRHIGGHSYILDFISLYGIIGLILLIKSYKAIYKTFFRQYRETPYYTYALMSFITAIILSMVNTGSHWFELTLLVPLALRMIHIRKSEVELKYENSLDYKYSH